MGWARPAADAWGELVGIATGPQKPQNQSWAFGLSLGFVYKLRGASIVYKPTKQTQCQPFPNFVYMDHSCRRFSLPTNGKVNQCLEEPKRYYMHVDKRSYFGQGLDQIL